MRLTLRTLLAYLDDILDPADKEQLAKKIESSEFAEDLVHRTRDTMRRLRLSAPQVIGSGMGLDPNTVAEYLDNVMPPESVGDFERICLESDMHLAEAAACHHVLTMVLGEPAEVDPLARQRMYTILQEGDARRRVRVEPAHAVGAAAVPASMPVQAAVAMPSTVAPAHVAPEVPEYLRTSSWGGMRGALVGLAAVALIAAGVYFLPELRARWGGGAAPVEIAQATPSDSAAGTPDDPSPIETAVAEPNQVVAQLDEPATGPALSGSVPSGTTEQPGAAVAAGDDRYSFPTADSPASQAPPAGDSPVSPFDNSTQPIEGAAQEGGLSQATPGAPELTAPSGANLGTANTTAQAALPMSEVPGAGPGVSGSTPPQVDPYAPTTLPATAVTDIAMPPETAVAAADIGTPVGTGTLEGSVPQDTTIGEVVPPADTVEVPAGPIELGTYDGDKTVLLKLDGNKGGWFRSELRSAVIEGDRLLALPEFRPKILLTSGVNVDLSGGTQVVMGTLGGEADAGGTATPEAKVPVIEVVYGRIILFNTSSDEQPLRIKVDATVADVRLAANAKLGVEVVRQYVPGRDPRQAPAPVIASFFTPDGGVEWQDAAGQKSVEGASRWSITEAVTSEIAADPSPPDWLDHEPVGQLSEQRYAAPKIETALVSNRPVDDQLLEMFQTFTQPEAKSLVAKCSVHVGLFQPFVEALRDSDQRPNWRRHIETLRSAMALSPESAENVKRALIEQRGPAADDLFEMLCGYSETQIGRTPDEMKSGAVARLIEWLEKDSLDYRVLAVENLSEITGKRLMPNPSASLKERTQNVRQWRSRLQSGDLAVVRR